MTKIMVKEGKGPGQHISPVSSTMKIVSKHLFCPMNNHRQRFLQKTTWVTIRGGTRVHSQLPNECDYLRRVLEFMAIVFVIIEISSALWTQKI